MKIYEVGGAVRDSLLSFEYHETDWVVVESSPQQMIELGFTPVGKHFPVFLHPTTKEEYALARTEKKVSTGHQGFEFFTDPSVTLEDDLGRRDLTINAIARDSKGTLIDPFNGLKDIEEVYLNGDFENRYPGIMNISFNYVEGESLIMATKDIAVSSGSACTSASLEPSFVLRAIGRSDELAHSSLRMSIGRFTSEEEIDTTIETVKKAVDKLRALSPLWEMYKDGIDMSKIEWAAH